METAMVASTIELTSWSNMSPSERLHEIQENLLKHMSNTARGKKAMTTRKYDLIRVGKEIAGMKLQGGLTLENIKQIELIEGGAAALKEEVDFQVSEFHATVGQWLEIIVIICILFEAWIAFSH